MSDADATGSGLADYARIVRERRWLIVVVTLACVGTAVGLTLRQQPRYAAIAQLDYAGENQSLGIVGAPTFPSRTSKELAEYGAQTILATSALHRVRKALATPRSVASLRGQLAASVDPQSNLVSVVAVADDPNFAAMLVNELARQTADGASRRLRFGYLVAANDLQRRRLKLGLGAKDVAQSSLYDQQITRLQALANIARPITVVKPAQPDADPVSPKPVRNAVVGLVVGLLLGLLAAFVRDAVDKRLRSVRDVRDVFDMPVVGHLRNDAMGAAGPLPGAVTLTPGDLEAFSVLRANLRHLGGDMPCHAIAVTSATPGEGKSTIAASLALSSALAGRRTLLVECDLRRPSLAGRLGLPEDGPGLTDYLAGAAGPGDVVHSLGLDPPPEIVAKGSRRRDAARSGGSRLGAPVRDASAGALAGAAAPLPLAVVLAGSPSTRPVALLGSPTFAELVAHVRGAYQVIVFDTSPLLTVADTLEVLPHVDGTLLCVRAGHTVRDQAEAARAVLERVPHGVVGLVITGVKRGSEAACGYYHAEHRVAQAAPAT
ncbi:MAG: tyrosine-protein kinase [Solirubrobacteraceae bacterium]|nr:tyrosine-protein kinase [Solirubrobacteraceae bacterium]